MICQAGYNNGCIVFLVPILYTFAQKAKTSDYVSLISRKKIEFNKVGFSKSEAKVAATEEAKLNLKF